MYCKYDLTNYKSAINLSHYAASLGYQLDLKKTSARSLVMKHPDGDGVVISKRGKNYVYFSVFDNNDNGTIIDFIMKRTGKTLSETCQELQRLMSELGGLPQDIKVLSDIEGNYCDIERIKALFSRMTPIKWDEYLVNTRKIPSFVLENTIFTGRIYRDAYGNIVFPHYTHTGVCGLELKNAHRSVFARGGVNLYSRYLWQ